jgi:hypothetical protein
LPKINKNSLIEKNIKIKIMKKIAIIIVTLVMQSSLMAQMQTYKITVLPSDKKLEISSGAGTLNIESHDGNEVIILSKLNTIDLPKEAEGLKPIVGGSIDNTNTGANVNKVGQVIKVKIPKTSMYSNFTIKVPKNMNTKVKEFANSYCTWNISGLSGELETKTSYSSVNITDATGPLLVHSDWGKVKVIYSKVAPDKPNSLYSNGGLDVTLPADCKANLNLLSSFGSVFTDFDIAQKVKTEQTDKDEDADKDKTETDEDNNDSEKNKPARVDRDNSKKDRNVNKDSGYSYAYTYGKDAITLKNELLKQQKANWSYASGITNSSDDCNCDNDSSTIGTINGGGVNITLRSDHSNIYLRKKK